MTWFAITSSGFDSVLCVLKVLGQWVLYPHSSQVFTLKSNSPTLLPAEFSPRYFSKRLQAVWKTGYQTQNALFGSITIPRFQTVKWWKENTETLSSSLANMLKYSVLKFSCLYRFVSGVFEIVLRIDGVLRKLTICHFFFFLSWELLGNVRVPDTGLVTTDGSEVRFRSCSDGCF